MSAIRADGGVRGARVLVAETEVVENGIVLWRDGAIAYAGAEADVPPDLQALADRAVDADGDWVLPGFIDMHVHGGYGSDFMDATTEAFDAIRAFHARVGGTTGLLATTVTAPPEALLRVLETAAEVAARDAVGRADGAGRVPGGADGVAALGSPAATSAGDAGYGGSAATSAGDAGYGGSATGGSGGAGTSEADNAAAAKVDGSRGAELYGVHLEGPFISPKWPGAQNPAFIVDPRTDWLEAWTQRFPGLVRMMTLAPERPGAHDAIAWLSTHGIIAACGHTDATYDDIEAAIGHGLQHAVHTFNAMRGLHHREPGTAGAVLTDARLCAEVIADGLHVHPACIALLAQLKTQHNLVLITDAMSAAGLGDGDYALGGLDVIVKDGAARLKQGGSLAGSTLTMIDAFRYVVRTVGLTVPQASVLASGNPARRLGLFEAAGSIAAGKRADLLRIASGDLALRQVWLRGQPL